MSNSYKHEDILIFLEENISRLVKLKVASRAKYNEYDRNYTNFLIAESCDDDIRVEMYGGMVEACYLSMRKKLESAIKENEELKQNRIIAEYMSLMH